MEQTNTMFQMSECRVETEVPSLDARGVENRNFNCTYMNCDMINKDV